MSLAGTRGLAALMAAVAALSVCSAAAAASWSPPQRLPGSTACDVAVRRDHSVVATWATASAPRKTRHGRLFVARAFMAIRSAAGTWSAPHVVWRRTNTVGLVRRVERVAYCPTIVLGRHDSTVLVWNEDVATRSHGVVRDDETVWRASRGAGGRWSRPRLWLHDAAERAAVSDEATGEASVELFNSPNRRNLAATVSRGPDGLWGRVQHFGYGGIEGGWSPTTFALAHGTGIAAWLDLGAHVLVRTWTGRGWTAVQHLPDAQKRCSQGGPNDAFPTLKAAIDGDGTLAVAGVCEEKAPAQPSVQDGFQVAVRRPGQPWAWLPPTLEGAQPVGLAFDAAHALHAAWLVTPEAPVPDTGTLRSAVLTPGAAALSPATSVTDVPADSDQVGFTIDAAGSPLAVVAEEPSDTSPGALLAVTPGEATQSFGSTTRDGPNVVSDTAAGLTALLWRSPAGVRFSAFGS